MSHGYTVSLFFANKDADNNSDGVVLGAECISRDIPVSLVARKLKVSRQTIYNWFSGHHIPSVYHTIEIHRFLRDIINDKYGKPKLTFK